MAADRFFLVLLSSFSCSKEGLPGVPSGCLCLMYFFGVLFPFGLDSQEKKKKKKGLTQTQRQTQKYNQTGEE